MFYRKVLPQLGTDWPQYSKQNSFMVLNPKNSSIIKGFNYDSCNLYKTVVQVHG